MSAGYYIMVDGEPCPVDDVRVWAKWYEDHSEERIIAKTLIAPGIEISTIFLGLDHNFGIDGAPILFETMVFGGDWADQECERYSSMAEARAGHATMVSKVIEEMNAKK